VIRTIHMLRVDEPDHNWESYWTTLTFEVAEQKAQ